MPQQEQRPKTAARRTTQPVETTTTPSKERKPLERGSTTLNLSLQIPSSQEVRKIQVPDNCTVESLLNGTRQDVEESGLDVSLRGSTLVFNGRTLSDSPSAELVSFGVKSGSELMVALAPEPEVAESAAASSEEISNDEENRSATPTPVAAATTATAADLNNPAAIKLLEIKKHFEQIKKELDTPLIDPKDQEKAKKVFFEDAMKLLYRLDALEGLPTSMRQQRKELVSTIQRMQDEATVSQILEDKML